MKHMLYRGLALWSRASWLWMVSILILSGPAHAAGKPGTSARTQVQNASLTEAKPIYGGRLHVAGNLRLGISNFGMLPWIEGGPYDSPGLDNNYPPVSGCSPLFEFPAGTCSRYLYDGGLWVGGIVAGDTLVSLTVEALSGLRDEFAGFDSMRESSNLEDSPFYDPRARSQQQFDCRYYDTLVLSSRDEIKGTPHKPLGLEISQTSHAWLSAPYDDFIIVEYSIRNISSAVIESTYVGFFMDNDVWSEQVPGGSHSDDLSGYLRDEGIAYSMDNDGDPLGDTIWDEASSRGAIGVVPLRIEPAPTCTTFNWWTSGNPDWGPARFGSPAEFVAPPLGDCNRYATMANGEIEYDQMWSATRLGWLRPPASWVGLASGADTRFLLSFGAFNLLPGDSVTVAMAFVAGDSIHQRPDDFRTFFNPFDPQRYYDRLYFGDLIRNAAAARRIYSNGFVPTGGAPVHIEAAPLSDTAVMLQWTRAPFPNVTEYRLFRRVSADSSSPQLIGSVPANRLFAGDLHAAAGVTYEYSVSAIGNDGAEGSPSRPVVLTAGRPVAVPTLDATNDAGHIRLTWSVEIPSLGFSPIEFINIYRRARNTMPAVLLTRIPVTEAAPKRSKTESEIEGAAARPAPTRLIPPLHVEIHGQLVDSMVTSGHEYFYSASMTNRLGQEGPHSAEDSVLSMAFDRGILLVLIMERSSPIHTLVNADSTRSFYFKWADQSGADTVFINRGWQGGSYPSLDTLSHYRSVILVWEEAVPGGADMYFAERLEEYMSNGGRCLLIGRYIPSRLSGVWWYPSAYSTIVHVFSEESFASRVLGVRRTEVESTWPARDVCQPAVQFVMASSAVTEYPSLRGDSARALDNPYFTDWVGDSCFILGGGFIPAVGVIDSIANAEVLYTYQAGYPDTSSFQGKPVAIRRDFGDGRVILFNFPLSLMERPAAWDALDAALADLEGTVATSARSTHQNTTPLLLEYLYGRQQITADRSWDMNKDGVIDIHDLVRSIGGPK